MDFTGPKGCAALVGPPIQCLRSRAARQLVSPHRLRSFCLPVKSSRPTFETPNGCRALTPIGRNRQNRSLANQFVGSWWGTPSPCPLPSGSVSDFLRQAFTTRAEIAICCRPNVGLGRPDLTAKTDMQSRSMLFRNGNQGLHLLSFLSSRANHSPCAPRTGFFPGRNEHNCGSRKAF